MVRTLLLSLLFMPLFGNAQITITASSFPGVGDSIRISKDNLPEGIVSGETGGPRTWDYKNLEAPYARVIAYTSPANGEWNSYFKEANLLAKTDDGQEFYYRKTANTLELVGYYGFDPLGLGIKGIGLYPTVKIEHHAPIKFMDNFPSEYVFHMALAVDDIPATFLDSLPITPDSLRIRITTNRTENADAYGKTQLAENLHQTLRVRLEDKMIISLDAKLPFLKWQDVTDLLPENTYFGKKTETWFFYFSNREVGPIVKILAGGRRAQNVINIEFKASENQKAMRQGLVPGLPGVLAYPNPAIQSAKFDFVSLEPGMYTLAMYNILGVQVYEKEWWIAGSKTVKIDLSNFKKGTYLYSLIDERGKTISTKRLMIIRP